MLLLKDSIECGQYIPSDKSVITVKHHNDFIIFAMISDAMINTVHGSFFLIIYENLDLGLWQLTFFDVFNDPLSCLFWRVVIKIDNMIVCVLLHEDWVKVAIKKAVCGVLIWRNDNAKWKLFLERWEVLGYVVFLLKILVFFFCDLFNLLKRQLVALN